jgi:hypothetical protein
MLQTPIFRASLLCLLAAAWTGSPSASLAEGVRIQEHADKLIIEIDGKPFSEYHFRNVSRPFLYPVLGPGGAPMTRNWPMREVEDEQRDHPHQRSLWYAHGDVNGHDFWSEAANAGKIVHDRFLEVRSGSDQGVIRSRNNWVARDGKTICVDERVLRIHRRPTNERVFDFEVTLHATNGELTLGDTKEGSMAIRIAETMRLKGKVATGNIVNSEGERDGATWGKRARWCDYHGMVDGKLVGVAIFDHPSNPRHPTWWHVRDYGLFAANPFGIHDFERNAPGTGNLKVAAGESVTFRYRFYMHQGNEQDAQVERRYREYVSETRAGLSHSE